MTRPQNPEETTLPAGIAPESETCRIPFNRPFISGREFDYMRLAARDGRLAAGGRFTARCESILAEWHGAPRALLTTSCTHALEMAALLLNLGPRDEVIVPAFTFVSTANAFALRGARPVFADIRPDTFNLDETKLEARITPATRAIVVVHYGGIGCEMDAILDIAVRRGLAVVEDNAHGLTGRYRGRTLGTFGAMATLSFHETKNLHCGEGGALIVNDAALVERAEIARDKGTDRARFMRGEASRYTWVGLGSSYGPSELSAAFLLAQLESRDLIQAMRRRLWEQYHEALAGWAEANGVTRPVIPEHCESAYHNYPMLMPTPEARARFITHMRARDILSVFHYVPLHTSPMGRTFGGREGDCPIAERVGATLVRLPFYNGMTDDERDAVVEAARAFGIRT